MFDVLGSLSSWKRLQRIRQRAVQALEEVPPEGQLEQLDFAETQLDLPLAFFVFVHAFGDWLVAGGRASKEDVEELRANSASLGFAADIANRAKHWKLKRRPRIDSNVTFQFCPDTSLSGTPRLQWWVEFETEAGKEAVAETEELYAGEAVDLLPLMDLCVEDLRQFLAEKGISNEWHESWRSSSTSERSTRS